MFGANSKLAYAGFRYAVACDLRALWKDVGRVQDAPHQIGSSDEKQCATIQCGSIHAGLDPPATDPIISEAAGCLLTAYKPEAHADSSASAQIGCLG